VTRDSTISYSYLFDEPAVVNGVSRPGLRAGAVAVRVRVDDGPTIIFSPESWEFIQGLAPHEQVRAILEWPR
jgi:hypothetical protein